MIGHKNLGIRIIEDWLFDLHGYKILIPKGFETDLASIPRFLWPIIAPMGDLRYGSIPHDFGYQYGYFLTPFDPSTDYPHVSLDNRSRYPIHFGTNIPIFIGESKGFFDKVFRDVNLGAIDGKNRLNITFKTTVCYYVLRCCSHLIWNRYRREGAGVLNKNSLCLPELTQTIKYNRNVLSLRGCKVVK